MNQAVSPLLRAANLLIPCKNASSKLSWSYSSSNFLFCRTRNKDRGRGFFGSWLLSKESRLTFPPFKKHKTSPTTLVSVVYRSRLGINTVTSEEVHWKHCKDEQIQRQEHWKKLRLGLTFSSKRWETTYVT